MGANAQTAVPVFTAGQVLTAAQMTQVNTGIPVFATTTTRDAAFGGTGEKTLAQGQTCYIEATSSYQTYTGSSWVALTTAPALVRVGGGTLSGASTAFTNIFSATYDAYEIFITNGTSTSGGLIRIIFGATTTGYYYGNPAVQPTTGAYSTAYSNGSNDPNMVVGATNSETWGFSLKVVNPQLASKTFVSGSSYGSTTANASGVVSGWLNNTTSYTGFTLSIGTGTFTGTVNIYGYALS